MPKLSEPLTDKLLRTLPVPVKGNVLYFDPELKGFAGRVTSKGARAFVGIYHLNGAERRDTIGVLGVWKAQAAREIFKRWRRDADLGIDPRGEPAAEGPEGATFKARAEQYLIDPRKKRQKTPLRPSTVKEYRRALLTYAAPLHDRPFDAIGRRDIAGLLDKVKAQRGAVSAMRARAAIGRLYSWGMARGYVEHSPVIGTEGWETPKRDRELSDDELRMVWAATAAPSPFNLIVRLLLWSGARPAEVGGMAKSELRADGAWEFQAERAKNGRPLVLPLPRQARDAIAAWQEAHPWRDPIVGRVGGKPFSGWSRAKRQLDERIARLDTKSMRPWQLRDLRRTVETRLASIGIPQEIINRVLNHAEGPITATYNRYEYAEPKRHALQKWADELDRIVAAPGTGNVVQMRGRR
jgi:integrase